MKYLGNLARNSWDVGDWWPVFDGTNSLGRSWFRQRFDSSKRMAGPSIGDPNIARPNNAGPDIGVMGLVTNGAKAIVFLTTRSLDGSEPKRMI